MAMPNVTGFEPNPDNPEWIRLNFDDGSQSPYAHDPDGRFRAEATQVASKLQPLAGNPLALPVPGAAPPVPAPVPQPLAANPLAMPVPAPAPVVGTPEALAAPGQPFVAKAPTLIAPSPDQARELKRQEGAHQRELGAGLSQQKVQEERDAQARADAEQAEGARPYQLVQTPGTGGVSASTTTQTGGLHPEDRKRIDAANQDAVEAQHQADQAALQARTEQVNAEWNRLTDAEKQKLAEQAALKAQEADFTAKVDAQSRKLEDITARPIDPSQAFGGGAGWYAFMAGFGDSIANFGAALAGRGPVANPGATIDRMIERSVALQTQQIEQEFKAGRLTADQLNAERDFIRAQLSTVGKQLADTQLQRAQTEQENLGLRAMRDKFEADRKAAIARNAAATARTQQTSTTVQQAPGTPGGVSLFMGEKPDWDAVKAHSERQSGADMMERGVSRAEKQNGWTWDEKANNGAGGYIGKDGKPVTVDEADPDGVSVGGVRFSAGEGGRELDGALDDIASGQAKLDDPVGAVSDKSIEAKRKSMNAGSDAGVLRAMERVRRNLRGMRASADAAFSPGVVNASRYRRSAETEFRNNQPGLPRSRAATAEDLRKNP